MSIKSVGIKQYLHNAKDNEILILSCCIIG